MNSETFRKNIKQILIPETDLQAKIKEVGAQISKEYDGKPLLLVSILNGAFVFMADLCRAITIPCETAFMCAKSYYSGTVSTENAAGKKSALPENHHAAGQARPPFSRPQSRPLFVYDSGLICHWLWAGLRRTLSQSSLYC